MCVERAGNARLRGEAAAAVRDADVAEVVPGWTCLWSSRSRRSQQLHASGEAVSVASCSVRSAARRGGDARSSAFGRSAGRKVGSAVVMSGERRARARAPRDVRARCSRLAPLTCGERE